MLKQRTWVIMTRPCIQAGNRVVVIPNELGKVNAPGGGEVVMAKWTEATPMVDGVAVSTGCWVEWYRTRSYLNVRREMRKLLKTLSRNDIMITEVIDIDTAITPQS